MTNKIDEVEGYYLHDFFRPEAYKKYDKIAKDAMITHLRLLESLKNCRVYENPKCKTQDIVVEKNGGVLFYVEVKIFEGWIEKEYPHNVLYIPIRKKISADEKTYFVSLSVDCTQGLAVTSKTLLNSPYQFFKSKNHGYPKRGCYQFVIPLWKCKKIILLKERG